MNQIKTGNKEKRTRKRYLIDLAAANGCFRYVDAPNSASFRRDGALSADWEERLLRERHPADTDAGGGRSIERAAKKGDAQPAAGRRSCGAARG